MGSDPAAMRFARPLLLALLAAPLAAPALPASPLDEVSLEELLERYRAERDALLATLATRADELLGDLARAVEAGDRTATFQARSALVELGPAVAPLLVGKLEPGPRAKKSERATSREVAAALAELPTFAVTLDLLELVKSGSTQARRNALLVLRTSEERERVSTELVDRYRRLPADVRPDALVVLASLGGDANLAFLGDLLFSEDADERASVLAAAAAAHRVEMGTQLLRMLEANVDAAGHASSIAEYYRTCPDAMTEDATLALVVVLREGNPSRDQSIALIDLLGEFKNRWALAAKRRLKELVGQGSREVEEAVLIALARPPSPDGKAKRQLLEPYDRAVDRNDEWWQAYRDRAQIQYRIEGYKSAIRDFQEALSLSREELRPQPDLYLGLARCYARTGKLKDASNWIEKAPISPAERRALADDPVFAEVRDHHRYGKVFGLPEGEQ